MELSEAMNNRHAVRSYTDKKIEGTVLDDLKKLIESCNHESGLHIQLCLDEPTAFTGMMAKYGKFTNVRNYIALVGKKSENLEETCGYYGEKIVLGAQQLGLNTCWVAATFNKKKSRAAISLNADEELLMIITVGYGTTGGTSHDSKSIELLSDISNFSPEWFRVAMKAVQLAPSAKNQQKFRFMLDGDKVSTSAGKGSYTNVDLGIAKYHFKVAAEGEKWTWAK